MTTWLAPFLIGIAGSLHCMGMCSPLVMAVTGPGKHAIFRNLQYNFGRVLTYAILGSVVSFAGKGLHMAGLQQWVSVAAGLVLLAIGTASIRISAPAFILGPVNRFTNILKSRFQQVAKGRNVFSTVVIGMINGLLPCGMTLVALGYCITLAEPSDGGIAMILFGLGTLPSMVGFASITRFVIGKLTISYKALQTGLLILSAIILIGRGIWNHDVLNSDTAGSDGIVVCESAGSR